MPTQGALSRGAPQANSGVVSLVRPLMRSALLSVAGASALTLSACVSTESGNPDFTPPQGTFSGAPTTEPTGSSSATASVSPTATMTASPTTSTPPNPPGTTTSTAPSSPSATATSTAPPTASTSPMVDAGSPLESIPFGCEQHDAGSDCGAADCASQSGRERSDAANCVVPSSAPPMGGAPNADPLGTDPFGAGGDGQFGALLDAG
jgi:hypothetical protein